MSQYQAGGLTLTFLSASGSLGAGASVELVLGRGCFFPRLSGESGDMVVFASTSFTNDDGKFRLTNNGAGARAYAASTDQVVA